MYTDRAQKNKSVLITLTGGTSISVRALLVVVAVVDAKKENSAIVLIKKPCYPV